MDVHVGNDATVVAAVDIDADVTLIDGTYFIVIEWDSE